MLCVLVLGIFKAIMGMLAEIESCLYAVEIGIERLYFSTICDGADSLHVELLPFVDLYYKKQLLTDVSYYLKALTAANCSRSITTTSTMFRTNGRYSSCIK